MISYGLMGVKPLITHRFSLNEMQQAMSLLEKGSFHYLKGADGERLRLMRFTDSPR